MNAHLQSTAYYSGVEKSGPRVCPTGWGVLAALPLLPYFCHCPWSRSWLEMRMERRWLEAGAETGRSRSHWWLLDLSPSHRDRTLLPSSPPSPPPTQQDVSGLQAQDTHHSPLDPFSQIVSVNCLQFCGNVFMIAEIIVVFLEKESKNFWNIEVYDL